MNIASIRPSTVDGIKQLAKKIHGEQRISYVLALDEASRQAGYDNFVNAKRQLGREHVPDLHPVYLSVHWCSGRANNVKRALSDLSSGRELLRLDLSRPLLEIVPKHRAPHARGLFGFRMEYEDHLEHRLNVDAQDKARQLLLGAARSLRFMEATGLQPVTTRKYQKLQRLMTRLPGRDHDSDWFDPVSASYVCLNEPDDPIRVSSPERDQWLAQNGLSCVAPDWPGIYCPWSCMPYLISPDGALLQRVASALVRVRPIRAPGFWPHETGICNDEFVSPRRQADAKPRRRRPGPFWVGHL
ncbi:MULTISPECIES: hypothetical protein [Achromobacter]|uniref:Uncharacterized protein n=1 Tax=Achromobacter xylosoxidans (strain A8) TaxID=762376 RepID=E3HY58_ACHXA|nr:hypothetical protein [Achromobacter xylosoxidans]ADP20012.1 hypothetical protein AXYL_06728 [Achromobacter xylosoxidans A8]